LLQATVPATEISRRMQRHAVILAFIRQTPRLAMVRIILV
jgi:hypothetical protein